MRVHNNYLDKSKTVRQWAKEGYLPKTGAVGTTMWSNQFCQRQCIYFELDQMEKATPEEVKAYLRAANKERIKR
ncbi:MAG: hypothetical protein IKI12_02720 [Lachnospiraceae bacterium]|nr:hypothetical protein [Lachnospiraceae bacterium]